MFSYHYHYCMQKCYVLNLFIFILDIHRGVFSTKWLVNYEKLFITEDTNFLETSSSSDSLAFLKRKDNSLLLDFKAFGLDIRVLAQLEELSLLDTPVIVHDKHGITRTTLRNLQVGTYLGIAIDRKQGKVTGNVRGYVDSHGVFNCRIETFNETYYIEPLRKFFQDNHFNAIIYRDSDLDFSRQDNSCLPGSLNCGLRMDDDIVPQARTDNTMKAVGRNYTEAKIDYQRYQDLNRPRFCDMEIIIDHTFYEHMQRDSRSTLGRVKMWVAHTNDVYKRVDFNRDGRGDNIGIRGVSFIIYKDQNDPNYKIPDPNTQALEALEIIGRFYFQKYCLQMWITHRIFPTELGRAHMGVPSLGGYRRGGICEEPEWRRDHWFHWNVAIITTVASYGTEMPEGVNLITFAHETGHAFGSDHDDLQIRNCAPGVENGGNYLMAPGHSPGAPRRNTFFFSSCSVDQIGPVLSVRDSVCFRDARPPPGYSPWDRGAPRAEGTEQGHLGPAGPVRLCGNYVIDDQEECDCGDPSKCDATDHCCIPPGKNNECKINRDSGYDCTPSQGPCCSYTCKFKTAGTACGMVMKEHGCVTPGQCRGSSAVCDEDGGVPVDDGVACMSSSRTCKSGKCISTVCQDNGATDCSCKDNVANECRVCCQHGGKCAPAANLGFFPRNKRAEAYKLKGTPCGSGDFVCNDTGVCVHRSALRSMDTVAHGFMESTVQWLIHNWLYFFCAGLLALFIYGLVIGKRYFDERRGGAKGFAKALQEAMKTVNEKYPEYKQGKKRPRTYELLCRLVALFPTAPIKELKKAAERHKSEERATKWLTEKGYKIKKM